MGDKANDSKTGRKAAGDAVGPITGGLQVSSLGLWWCVLRCLRAGRGLRIGGKAIWLYVLDTVSQFRRELTAATRAFPFRALLLVGGDPLACATAAPPGLPCPVLPSSRSALGRRSGAHRL